MTRLVQRFKDELGVEMELVTAQFTNFIIVGDKHVTSQIDTLDGIVQQLEHQQLTLRSNEAAVGCFL